MRYPFIHADKAIKALYQTAEREFSNYALTLAGFDQLNLIQVRTLTDEMYAKLDTEVRKKYLGILQKRYREVMKEMNYTGEMKEPELMDLLLILQAYNKTVKYQYENEWNRKRDRLVESVMSVDDGDNQGIRGVVQTGLNGVEGQIRFFADIVTDEADLKAMQDGGVLFVQWITRNDERVCEICGERDLKVFPIHEVPPFPAHPRCRCRLIPHFL